MQLNSSVNKRNIFYIAVAFPICLFSNAFFSIMCTFCHFDIQRYAPMINVPLTALSTSGSCLTRNTCLTQLAVQSGNKLFSCHTKY